MAAQFQWNNSERGAAALAVVVTAGARILARHQGRQFAGHDDDAAAVADDHAGAHEFARLHVDPLQIQALRIAEYASVLRLWTFGQLAHSKNSAIQSPSETRQGLSCEEISEYSAVDAAFIRTWY